MQIKTKQFMIKVWKNGKWNNTTKERWTYEFIFELNEWIQRKHGELDSYLTQMPAGHGCFREYLYKYKHVEDHFCLYCPYKTEYARLILLECIRFTEQRTKIQTLLNEKLTPRDLLKCMLTSEEACNEIAKIIKNIMERFRSAEEQNRNLNPLSQERKGAYDNMHGAAIMLKTTA